MATSKGAVLYLISIHAPPRGATLAFTLDASPMISFQFTPLREGRQRRADDSHVHRRFQFTPLREGRRKNRKKMRKRTYFNSRPSARGDVVDALPVLTERPISIHAPPRGATLPLSAAADARWYFNSRPSARGDCADVRDGAVTDISIHAPPRGATTAVVSSPTVAVFQFTPLREGRLLTTEGNPVALNISIHAPPRGATAAAAQSSTAVNISIHAPPRGATKWTSRKPPP